MLLDYLKTCRYIIPRLKNQVILFNDLSVKHILIDTNGEAYVNGITGSPLVIECFDVQFDEESTVNGRFLYDKTVSFSVQGYRKPDDVFGARRRIAVVTENNEYRLVNVDFAAKMTYVYTLDGDNSYTRFTFHSYSNYPTLRLVGDYNNTEKYCGFAYDGADKLKMNYVTASRLNRNSGVVTTNGELYLPIEPDSYTFTEEYDGDVYTDTLTITIPITDYRSSWHYNLEEFKRNRYNAIITTKNGFNIFTGFIHGLFPTYTITASRESDYITVTLVERSHEGSVGFDSLTIISNTNKKWANVDWFGEQTLYDCAGDGLAEYVLQMEVDAFGNPTGVYRCKAGMEDYFEEMGIEVSETFETSQTFPSAQCMQSNCGLLSDIPELIVFNGVQTKSYTLSSNCSWQINGVPSGITIDTMSGGENITYQINIQNTDATERTGTFSIKHGNTIEIISFKVVSSNFIAPTSYTINCESQSVTFYHDASCNVSLNNEDGVTYGNGNFSILLPDNNTTSSKTYTYQATNCNGKTQTLYIYQNPRYEEWRRLNNEYICNGGNTYELLTLFTGTTSSNLKETAEKRSGSLIAESTLCSNLYERWIFNGNYICDGNAKYEMLEHQYSYDEENWLNYGEYQIGNYVGEDSGYCSNVQYKWVLTYDVICDKDIEREEPEVDYKAMVYGNNTSYGIVENGSGTITQTEVRGLDIPYSSITAVTLGDTITSIGTNAFQGCSSLERVTMNDNKVRTIGNNAFMNCTSLTSFTMTDSVTTVGEAIFYGCSNLKTLRISPYINTIGERMCKNCYSLEFVTIPFAVHNIGNFAFAGCSKLFVTMENYKPCTLDLGLVDVYHQFDAVKSISVPASSVSTYATATGWSNYQSLLVGRN